MALTDAGPVWSASPLWSELKGAGDLKRVLTSDMEMQIWSLPAGFQACFGPVVPDYAPFLPSRMTGHTLCYFMLKVCHLLFDFTGVTVRDWLFSEESLDF